MSRDRGAKSRSPIANSMGELWPGQIRANSCLCRAFGGRKFGIGDSLTSIIFGDRPYPVLKNLR